MTATATATPTATRPTTVGELDFLVGHWKGQGFVMNFAPPHVGMLFGSMQADDGVYWETFRLAEEGGGVIFHATQMGKPCGRYRLVELAREGERRRAVFEDPEAKIRRLTYASARAGSALEATAEGEKSGQPYRESWPLTRA